MREEERPQIVVTNPSTDMSQEELAEEIKKHHEDEDSASMERMLPKDRS